MTPSANILAILIYILAVITIYHSYKFRGAFKTLLFLIGTFIIGGGIENINITFDGYYYPYAELNFYMYFCPLWVILGWYLIIYCGSFMAHIIVGKGYGSLPIIGIGTKLDSGVNSKFFKFTVWRSLLAAYISMLIGIVMDTMAANNGWWVWKINNIYIFEVPFGNFIGWVLVAFWMLLFHDLLIAWSTAKQKKEIITAALWSGISIAAMFVAGVILMGLTFWFGVKGVRTDNRNALDITITPERWANLMITLVFVLICIGALIASSYAPNRAPEPRPTKKLLWILPSIMLIIYWAVMIVVSAMTSSLMVANGVLFCVPLWIICGYRIKHPFLE